jgi:hypothetical protein
VIFQLESNIAIDPSTSAINSSPRSSASCGHYFPSSSPTTTQII